MLVIVLHGHGDEAITEQSRTTDGENASLRDLDILVDFQEDGNAAHVGKHLRRLGNLTDPGSRERDVSSLQKAAGIPVFNGQSVEFLHALTESPEINDKRSDAKEAENHKESGAELGRCIGGVHVEAVVAQSIS